ncbi:hypothetical protein [Streptosporangium roseum]|uniref:hypothetical protein n=1 Tax=Streptosporangium roseum TaxID=2001 RepID=UPI00332F5843
MSAVLTPAAPARALRRRTGTVLRRRTGTVLPRRTGTVLRRRTGVAVCRACLRVGSSVTGAA